MLTINLLGVGAGAGGRIFERLMLRRRSMIAAVGFDLWRAACNSCTLGNNSDMISITGSRGSL